MPSIFTRVLTAILMTASSATWAAEMKTEINLVPSFICSNAISSEEYYHFVQYIVEKEKTRTADAPDGFIPINERMEKDGVCIENINIIAAFGGMGIIGQSCNSSEESFIQALSQMLHIKPNMVNREGHNMIEFKTSEDMDLGVYRGDMMEMMKTGKFQPAPDSKVISYNCTPPKIKRVEELPLHQQVYETLFRELSDLGNNPVVRKTAFHSGDFQKYKNDIPRLYLFGFLKADKYLAPALESVPIQLLSEEAYKGIFTDANNCSAGWDIFQQKFPQAKSLVELSTVGLTYNQKEAVVRMTTKNSANCDQGASRFLFFNRDGAGWKWVKTMPVNSP